MSQYGVKQSIVMGNMFEKAEMQRMEEYYSKLLSEASYASSLWGYLGAGAAVGLTILSGGTAAPLLAAVGGAGYYAGSEYGEQDVLDYMDLDDTATQYSEYQYVSEKEEAQREVEAELDAEQLAGTIGTAKGIYSLAGMPDVVSFAGDVGSNISSLWDLLYGGEMEGTEVVSEFGNMVT